MSEKEKFLNVMKLNNKQIALFGCFFGVSSYFGVMLQMLLTDMFRLENSVKVLMRKIEDKTTL